jgi:hypothetical protein
MLEEPICGSPTLEIEQDGISVSLILKFADAYTAIAAYDSMRERAEDGWLEVHLKRSVE